MLALSPTLALAEDAAVTAVKAAVLIDGMGAAPVRDVVILIEGERIKAVGPGLPIPPGARTIDLGSSTVLPGFIDAHTHISAPLVGTPGWDQVTPRETVADVALRGAGHARQTLEAGFTTIREVGARGFSDVSLRNAIRSGWVVGPRMQVAAHALSITGGHCDDSGWAPKLFGFEPGIAEGIANGPEEIRSAIRYQVKYGAEVIKICATGGVMSVGDTAGAQQYTAEELRVAVETAHMLERKITAHAHGTEGIKAAVRAGVDSIEHGSLLDDEGARLMAQKGTALVSTLTAGDAVIRMAHDGRITGEYAAEGPRRGSRTCPGRSRAPRRPASRSSSGPTTSSSLTPRTPASTGYWSRLGSRRCRRSWRGRPPRLGTWGGPRTWGRSPPAGSPTWSPSKETPFRTSTGSSESTSS